MVSQTLTHTICIIVSIFVYSLDIEEILIKHLELNSKSVKNTHSNQNYVLMFLL